jgi:hypothetical protein
MNKELAIIAVLAHVLDLYLLCRVWSIKLRVLPRRLDWERLVAGSAAAGVVTAAPSACSLRNEYKCTKLYVYCAYI